MDVCICVSTYIHTYIHACMHAYKHTHRLVTYCEYNTAERSKATIHTYTHTHTYINTQIHKCILTYIQAGDILRV